MGGYMSLFQCFIANNEMIQKYIFCEVAYILQWGFFHGMDYSPLPISIPLLEQSSSISHNIHAKNDWKIMDILYHNHKCGMVMGGGVCVYVCVCVWEGGGGGGGGDVDA